MLNWIYVYISPCTYVTYSLGYGYFNFYSYKLCMRVPTSTSLLTLVLILLCCFHYNAFISLMLSFAFSWMWLGSSIFLLVYRPSGFPFCELPAPIFYWLFVFFLLWLFYIFWTVMKLLWKCYEHFLLGYGVFLICFYGTFHWRDFLCVKCTNISPYNLCLCVY